jgi:zinc D-Ala-D-Ala carboxypeptidase
MRLSDHFTLSEFTKSQTADRHGIDNTPDDAQTERLKILCENVLEPVRVHFGKSFTPSSGFRSEELCLKIGSKTTSQHAKGEAVDFEIPGVDNKELAYWISDNLDFDQLILEYYKPGIPDSGWVHVSYKGEGNRNEVLTMTKGVGYSFGLPN